MPDLVTPLRSLTSETRLALIRERLARGDYQQLDVARAVARRLLRDDFHDADP